MTKKEMPIWAYIDENGNPSLFKVWENGYLERSPYSFDVMSASARAVYDKGLVYFLGCSLDYEDGPIPGWPLSGDAEEALRRADTMKNGL